MSAHMIEPRCQITATPYTPPVSGHLRQSGKMVSSCRAIISSPPARRSTFTGLRLRGQGDPESARCTNLEAGAGPGMPAVPNSRYSPPVHIIRLTTEREITPYVWVLAGASQREDVLRDVSGKFPDEGDAAGHRPTCRYRLRQSTNS
jgi:hypothetical protein